MWMITKGSWLNSTPGGTDMNIQQSIATITKFAVMLLIVAMIMPASAQQLPDMEFHFQINKPAFDKTKGPKLLIDKAHSPYLEQGSYEPFLRMVRDDGFRADYLETKITPQTLEDVQILVIVNSYHEDYGQFSIMQPPSAYSSDEINIIRDWVNGGGRLMIIADHAPFAGGSSALAEAFGFTFFNGYVFEKSSLPYGYGYINYQENNGLNLKNPVISGKFIEEEIDRFFTFNGTAFIPPANATRLLTVPAGYVAVMTQYIRREMETAPKIDVSGMSQGSTLIANKGRLAVFGEAAAFTAQITDKTKRTGMNNPKASQNPLLVLATMRWLAQGL